MRAQDEIRQLFGIGMRSASIWCLQKLVKTLNITKNQGLCQKQTFLEKAASFFKKKAPAAACDSAKLKGYKHKYWLFDI